MKIPHHLILARSGRWHFRRRVPADLVAVLRRKFIKKSLSTSVLLVAQLRAVAVNAQCVSTFVALRARSMPRKRASKPSRGRDALDRFDYTMRLPDGLFIESNGEEDQARALEMVKVLTPLLLARETKVAAAAAPTPSTGIKLGAAARDWLLTLETTTIKKTRSQMRAAIEGFAEGRRSMPLADVQRTDLSAWIQVLRNSGVATPTIANKMSYVARFFEWAMGGGHYPQGDNPARKQIKYSKREKILRRQHGWRPFTSDEIRVLYHPAHLITLSVAKRWAAVLVLYTGARVSEIAQLAIGDVRDSDSVACLFITDESPGQSLKNPGSKRVVPVHPDLIALGFDTYVTNLRAQGEQWVFPKSKVDAVNGRGNSFSSAFTRHIKSYLPPAQDSRKRGFHSLRSTATQRMQDGKVRAEFRMQYTGHEQDDVHHMNYSRKYTRAELAAEVHHAMKFGLDIPGVAAILQVDPPPRRRRSRRTDTLD